MAVQDFAVALAAALREVVRPLDDAFDSPAAAGSLLLQHGWAPPTDSAYTAQLGGEFNVAVRLAALATPLESILGQPDPSPDDVAAALDAAVQFIEAVIAFASGTPPSQPASLGADLWSEFPRDLYSGLFADYFRIHHPLLYALLRVSGVILRTEEAAADRPGRVTYTRTDIQWGRLVDLVTDPGKVARTDFGWGSTLNYLELFTRLRESLAVLNVWSSVVRARHPFVGDYYADDNPALADLWMLQSTLYRWHDSDGSVIDVSFLLLPIPASGDRSGPPVGLLIAPMVTGDTSTAIGLGGPFALSLYGGFESDAPVGIELRPDSIDIAGPSLTGTSATIGATLAIEPRDPWIVAGTANSSRLEIAGANFSIEATGSAANLELTVKLASDVIRLVLDPTESDGFVSPLIGAAPPPVEGTVSIAWSSQRGLIFGGSSSLDVRIPVNLSLGAVTLSYIRLSILPDKGKVVASASLSGSASIGPLGVTIQDIGVAATMLPHAAGDPVGSFGDLDVTLGFKPPTGVGLVIDTAGVTGGGFLGYTDANHEYSGVLQLRFTDLALQAFGLITTQVAGGAGYSILALVDAEFPPVPLGWGFTLNGVGGLLAMHRTADVDALHAALNAGQLSTILFPKNAIKNATQILAELDAIFPTAQGRFLFGPMALIGWGTPTVLTAAIAVVIELPEPVRIVLIARVSVRVPSESAPLVRINMDALGVLDLSRSSFSLDAKLFDSKLLAYTLSGDMALRANWGSQREFLLAIGGFNPQFSPPAGFPTLQRITIDMPSGPVSKLRLAAYLAITSNTVQFGATLDVFVGVSGFGLAGHLGFDALMTLDPFHFEADISGQVALTAGGDDLMSVGLDATLSGPAPWHIAGDFKIHIVFFDVTISFSESWGDDAPALQIAPVDVLPLLTAALADVRNWGAALPAGTSALVSLNNPGMPLVHPLARLEVHESVVPLGIAITRFGSASIANANTFSITDYQVNQSTLDHEAVEDVFAPAQFFDLSDQEKLARPSFETHDAGVRLTGKGLVACGPPVAKTIAYETFYIDHTGDQPRTDPVTPRKTFGIGDLNFILYFGASGRAGIRAAGESRYAAPGTPIRIAPQSFTIADTATLSPAGIGAPAGTTYTEAQAAFQAAIATDPGRRANLQIVSIHELPVA